MDLSGLQEGTDDVVASLCVGPSRASLHTLRLDRWEDLSDKALESIAGTLGSLSTLDLAHCTDLTENGVLKMIAKLDAIEAIGLGRGQHITARGKFLIMQLLKAKNNP